MNSRITPFTVTDSTLCCTQPPIAYSDRRHGARNFGNESTASSRRLLQLLRINTPIPMRLARTEESAQSMSHLALNFCPQVGALARICCRLHTPCTDCELASARMSRCLHTPCTDCTVSCAHNVIYRNQDVTKARRRA